jgi:uncharacterized delta-60 repeat protein
MPVSRVASCVLTFLVLAAAFGVEAEQVDAIQVDALLVPCDKNHFILELPCAPPAIKTTPNFYNVVTVSHGFGTLLAGSELHGNSLSLAVVRVVNANGLLDPAWGDAGWARVPIWGYFDRPTSIALQPDGKLVVAGFSSDPSPGYEYDADMGIGWYASITSYIWVIRLNADGTLDASFNGTGRLIFSLSGGLPLEIVDLPPIRVRVMDDGNVEVETNFLVWHEAIRTTAVIRINRDGTLDEPYNAMLGNLKPLEAGFAVVIEYTNNRDQYFLTSSRDEFGLLDRDATYGWHRTGEAFHAFPPGTAEPRGAPVCRFYGKPELGLGNHFYTADPGECAILAGDPRHAWMLESKEAFRLGIPDAGTGSCEGGQVPVYRLLAPRRDFAHRFITDPKVRDAAIRQGWIAEGYGPQKVALCGAPLR